MMVYTVTLKSLPEMTDDQFYWLCHANPNLKLERNSQGELIIVSPTGGETGNRNSEIGADLVWWNRRTQLGKVFDSSTCFKLPNGGDRSPDLAWIRQERWDSLTAEQKEKFPPLAPDFVLELMSPTDSFSETQAKMREYTNSGVRLGWLIHRQSRTVEIYRWGREVETLRSPDTLSGEDILPGFVLNLSFVW
jgi:Uma2 family endonuclease